MQLAHLLEQEHGIRKPAEYRRDLQRDLEDLGRSGRGWARDATDPDASAGHIYFSAAGFTDDFADRAAGDDRLRLISLDDLFESAE